MPTNSLGRRTVGQARLLRGEGLAPFLLPSCGLAPYLSGLCDLIVKGTASRGVADARKEVLLSPKEHRTHLGILLKCTPLIQCPGGARESPFLTSFWVVMLPAQGPPLGVEDVKCTACQEEEGGGYISTPTWVPFWEWQGASILG